MGTALTLADLNTAVNHEPRIAHQRLAEALGYADLHKMKHLVERHTEALQRFGDISATVAENKDPKGRGRPGKTYWLNKKQALYLCTKSETANATEVTIQMVEVFDAYLDAREKPVEVKAHRRREPRPAQKPVPGVLEAGSDLLQDLILVMKVARVRMQDGLASDPLEVMQGVLEDYAARNAGEPTSGKGLGDYNWSRVPGVQNVDLFKARRAGPAQ